MMSSSSPPVGQTDATGPVGAESQPTAEAQGAAFQQALDQEAARQASEAAPPPSAQAAPPAQPPGGGSAAGGWTDEDAIIYAQLAAASYAEPVEAVPTNEAPATRIEAGPSGAEPVSTEEAAAGVAPVGTAIPTEPTAAEAVSREERVTPSATPTSGSEPLILGPEQAYLPLSEADLEARLSSGDEAVELDYDLNADGDADVAVFRNLHTDEYVVAFEGIQPELDDAARAADMMVGESTDWMRNGVSLAATVDSLAELEAVTGHSAGGAVASVAGTQLREPTHTFGSASVGRNNYRSDGLEEQGDPDPTQGEWSILPRPSGSSDDARLPAASEYVVAHYLPNDPVPTWDYHLLGEADEVPSDVEGMGAHDMKEMIAALEARRDGAPPPS